MASAKFQEYKDFNLSEINKEILRKWKEDGTFQKSLDPEKRPESFVFYEGPPSANGIPGIHHVMARSIKDIFCRYKSMKGYLVRRKAGWDTHGLPVELGVEKTLGITKEDIGTKITVEEYNDRCRVEVMKYTDLWEELTDKMGFWLDTKNPYITFESKYIESLWNLLKGLYDKGLLYKGYSIQPYSPAAGTGLSSHELNLPGCYKNVKDTTGVAMFKLIPDEKSDFLCSITDTDVHVLAWTTTPWTLLSNTALAVGAKITYLTVRSFNPYSGNPITVVLAKDLFRNFFQEKDCELELSEYNPGDKRIPYKMLAEFPGKDLEHCCYEQLLPYQQPETGEAFKILLGDFVTTEDGTGVVHLAPSFGADDFRVAQQYGIGYLTLVDKQGKFVANCGEFSGKYVKNSFDESLSEGAESVDVEIIVKLKKENKLFKTEKYEHSYPHCWRTDKPILYYPLDSWFIRTTSMKQRMIELNNTINWQPPSTGTGRFGQWLENLVDWNLSRSRYWGTPLPIWRTEDGEEEICIGSFAELKLEVEKSIKAGFLTKNLLENFVPEDFSDENYRNFDPHKPFVDDIILVSPKGKKMSREKDLIDVWFDSGAMPYAQLHYPFENQEFFKSFFPADFIAEGVDQTRGWFFTLHAISTMLFDSVAFKNIISNGLVLDKEGNKMSKRLGNAVDPFETIEQYGSDPVRWYMITNASPWDNLKFDCNGIEEVKRKFFGTLYNTYSFFSLYANVDGFSMKEELIPVSRRTELDRWILSLLNSLINEVDFQYENYDPTKAGRAIQTFVTENLSNWYVRLCRKRFWMGEYTSDKITAYQTLYTCLETVAKLAAPIMPFYADQLFSDLTNVTKTHSVSSVHLADFPKSEETLIDVELEKRMYLAQKISSMILSLRRKVNIKVRQPLRLIKIPVLSENEASMLRDVESIILSEVNVKHLEIISGEDKTIIKKIKPNFKTLGPKHGKLMKQIAAQIANFTMEDIYKMENTSKILVTVENQTIPILNEDVEISTEDISGWLVASEGRHTVALDISISNELKEEGIAREFINRIQNFRKESNFNVTDKIILEIQQHEKINSAIRNFDEYIKSQTLAVVIILVEKMEQSEAKHVEIDKQISTYLKVYKS